MLSQPDLEGTCYSFCRALSVGLDQSWSGWVGVVPGCRYQHGGGSLDFISEAARGLLWRLVVRTPSLSCTGSIPGRGAEIPHATQ